MTQADLLLKLNAKRKTEINRNLSKHDSPDNLMKVSGPKVIQFDLIAG